MTSWVLVEINREMCECKYLGSDPFSEPGDFASCWRFDSKADAQAVNRIYGLSLVAKRLPAWMY